MKRLRQFPLYGLLLLLSLTACRVKRPDTVLPDAVMERLLYDYHIARAMGDELPRDDNYKRDLYLESVFRKYGTTQVGFDTSMVWYARHPDVLAKIYENVNKRLKDERDLLNRLIALRDGRPLESLPGDSINVWQWHHIYRLTGMPLDNKLAFVLPSDSNFHERDTLRWSLRYHFYNGVPDSLHAPMMSLQIAYKNDSTLSELLKVYASGTQTITLASDTLGELKEVRGFIYYPAPTASHNLLLDSITLMRYHADEAVADSLELETDSLI
ncbi:MAG: DUF4296 domain-containing protein [Prevotellaceae bacterium]|jgi:hypothetical protein|nr:DUF4296 domain-containing protein [Prevotellaceae bacterium]